MQYCSLQHQTLLPSPVHTTTTFTTGCCFCFGSVSSFFLELYFHLSPVTYWAPTDLGSSSFSVISSCLFILFMGFSRQEYWSGLPFPSSVDHIFSEVSTMTCPSWVPYIAWLSFIELDKAVVHVIRLASFLWLWFSVSLPTDALSQCLPSYWGFSYLEHRVSLPSYSIIVQPLLLTLDLGYLLTAATTDLGCGVSHLGCLPLQCCTGANICIIIAELCCCMEEANTTL